jgi:hypothetical protein
MASPIAPRPLGSNAEAAVLGALLIVAPLLIGWVVGRALRPLAAGGGRWRRAAVAALAVVPLLLAVPAAGAIPSIGSWDVVMFMVWLALAMLLSILHVPSARTRAALLVIPAVSLAALELLSRLALPPLPPYPPAREARLVVSFSNRDAPCEAIFPQATGFIESRAAAAGERPLTVVHVGDSMVFGNGVQPEQAFPALLEARDDRVAHINAGTPGAGPDANLLAAAHWRQEIRPDLTVVYFFMGNDVDDIDRAYTCCEMGPLLDWSKPEPTPRCTALEWTFPAGVLLSSSPPPYPFRVAAGWSAFAAHVTAAFDAINRGILKAQLFNVNFATVSARPLAERMDKVGRILRALRDGYGADRARLLLVILPFRQTLERAHGIAPSNLDPWGSLADGRGAEVRVGAIARDLGLDVLDAWDVLDAAITREGVEPWFADDYRGDVHLSARGHALIADWLGPEIVARLSRPAAARAAVADAAALSAR